MFLAIAVVHILPEEAELWQEINPGTLHLFPFPYLLMICGYSLLLIFDKVVFANLLHPDQEENDEVPQTQILY